MIECISDVHPEVATLYDPPISVRINSTQKSILSLTIHFFFIFVFSTLSISTFMLARIYRKFVDNRDYKKVHPRERKIFSDDK